jgi:putative ABC transport system substrate-binding protein
MLVRTPWGEALRRREFIALIGGATAALPLPARAQQPEQMRRVGVLLAENDPNQQADQTKFSNALRESGWTEGRNITVDYRWAAGDPHRIPVS